MKAITLTQPWATLVAIGAKRIETRSRPTKFRGPLAIHAAKGWTKDVVKLFFSEPFRHVLGEAGYTLFSLLPRGAILATCTLIDCVPTNKMIGLDFLESAFGDFASGRFAWLLKDIEQLREPLPARGALGLWEYGGVVDSGDVQPIRGAVQ